MSSDSGRLGVVRVRPDTPVAECANLMLDHDVRHLPVVEGGALVGLVTDWSVFQRGALRDGRWTPRDEADAHLLAKAIARPAEVVVQPHDPAAPTLRALLASFQETAVVVDADDRPVGMITEHDVLRLAAELVDDDLWSTDLPTGRAAVVGRDAPVRRCLAILVRQPARYLLVADDEALAGVLSFGDLAREPFADDAEAGDLLVGRPPDYAVGAVPVRYAAQAMLTQGIGCLPIVDRELRPLRILTRLDLVRAVLDSLEREATGLRQEQAILALT